MRKQSIGGLLPVFFSALALSSLSISTAWADVRLTGNVPALAKQSQALGELDAAQAMHLSLALPLRNSSQLESFIAAVSDPTSAFYGHYLTPAQFTDLYGPTQEDYDKAAAFATANGLTVTQTYGSRTLLGVVGTAGTIAKTFGLRLLRYQSASDGHVFYAPDTEPAVPTALAGVITGVLGLDNADPPHRLSHPTRDLHHLLGKYILPQTPPGSLTAFAAGGPHRPEGGFSPNDLKRAYSLDTLSLDGTGQTMAVTEFGPLQKSDVTTYEDFYGLPHITLEDVAVDGTVYTYVPGQSDDGEEALDCELLVALAPQATKILIYNGGFTFTDNFTKFANDDRAKILSVSYGGGDNLQAEQNALMECAAQGQSVFCASGDTGAYNGGSSLSVNNPASQPYLTGVGGTTLFTDANGNYTTERVWGGSGGGIDPNWALPSYQTGIANAANLASTTHRNVPDVSANADPGSGFSVFLNGGWGVLGGTSGAAPLWGGFTTLVNEQRTLNGLASAGFLNPALYAIYRGSNYASVFHDITVGSNGFYPAAVGYDNSTGLGTFNGGSLIHTLAPNPLVATLSGPAGTNGWYQGTVTVSLAVANPNDASDVASIYYTVDGGPTQTYSTTGVGTTTGPFPVAGDNIHALTFWVVNTQGTEETPHQTGTVKIDSVAPTLTFGAATPAPNAAGWNNTAVSVPYTASDATSGVATAVPGSPVRFTAEGTGQTRTVAVTDVAGNAASFATPTPVSIDLTAPVTALSEADTAAGATYTLSATDALSGVAATYYAVDGGARQAYTAPFTVATPGGHSVAYFSVDVAGNAEAAHTATGTVSPAPYLGALAPAGVQVGGPDLTLRVTGGGFVPASVVDWDGTALVTVYVSPTELDATVPAADTAGVGRHSVTVSTPAPGGGVSGALTFAVTDAHVPVTVATVDGPGGNGHYRGGVTVTLTATDADGNLAGTFYTLDGSAARTYSAPVGVTGVGGHTMAYWSTDTSGNEEAHHSLTLVIDTAGPTTTASLSGQAVANGWYKGDVTVTLSATDPDGAADIAATYYTLDGGARQTYTAPLAVTGDAVHAVTFWSVDQAGNEEAPHKAASVKIDGTAPALTFGTPSPAPNAAGWNDTPVSVPYTASDATSGVASATPGSPVRFAAEGQGQTQSVTVTDVAGNGASSATPPVSIDLTAPATAGSVSGGVLTLTATDALSGVASTSYAVDGGAQQPYTGPVALGTGSHTVTYSSTDRAGNAEGAHTLTTTVTPPAPSVLHVYPAGVQMFAVPRDLSGVPTGMDYVPSPLFVWSPALTQYVMGAGGSASSVSPGGAYWGRFRQSGTLYDVGSKTDTGKPFSIALKAGWNMIGSPFESSVAAKTLVIVDGSGVSHDIADAASSGLISYNLYSYPAGATAYTVLTVPGGSLDPYLGYWIHAAKDETLVIPGPTQRVPL